MTSVSSAYLLALENFRHSSKSFRYMTNVEWLNADFAILCVHLSLFSASFSPVPFFCSFNQPVLKSLQAQLFYSMIHRQIDKISTPISVQSSKFFFSAMTRLNLCFRSKQLFWKLSNNILSKHVSKNWFQTIHIFKLAASSWNF